MTPTQPDATKGNDVHGSTSQLSALATRAWRPPPFDDQPRRLQAVDAFILPVAWGFACGLILSLSEVAFFAGCVIAAAGGVSAGLQHREAKAALTRGLVGSALFGAAILAGHAAAGADPTHAIPHPQILQLPISIIPGVLLALLGRSLLTRREAQGELLA